jgi:geranylgeranyl reductase family protein
MHAFDALVAGAGPAGAIAARDLARRGARVALIDGSHPREKPCGGGVTGRALQLVGATLAAGDGQTIDAVTFQAGARTARVPMPDREALRVFPRAAFDAALLRQAIDAGATHIASRVQRLTRTRGAWQVAAANQSLTAPWLLGADGPAGVVRKHVFRPFARRQLSIAAGSYVDGVDTAEIVIAFTAEPSGYLWSFPRAGHVAIGTCAQANETSAAEMHAITDQWIDGYPPAAGRARRRYAWPIPSLEARDVDAECPAGDGWMLLGDAAGLVDPITREGIFFALRSGLLAAGALATASPARAYTTGVRDELHDELRRAARLKAGFFRPRFTGLMVEALSQSAGVRAVMIDLVAGRQPYAGLKRRLMGTLEWGLMLRVLLA